MMPLHASGPMRTMTKSALRSVHINRSVSFLSFQCMAEAYQTSASFFGASHRAACHAPGGWCLVQPSLTVASSPDHINVASCFRLLLPRFCVQQTESAMDAVSAWAYAVTPVTLESFHPGWHCVFRHRQAQRRTPKTTPPSTGIPTA